MPRSSSSDARSAGQELLDRIPAAILTTDKSGRIILWGRYAEALWGPSPDEALGRPVAEVLLEPEMEPVVEALRACDPIEIEAVVRRTDGRERACMIRVVPEIEEGRTIGAAALAVDVTERQRQERRLQAQYAAARVLAEATDVDEAATRLVGEVATAIDWHAGGMWVVDEDEGVLRFVGGWSDGHEAAESFLRVSDSTRFRRGMGLPGRVWESGEAAWVPLVDEQEHFPRRSEAAAAGLRSGFCFPIRLGSKVLGAMELFTRDLQDPDHRLLEAMEAVGSQIGQFVERRTALEAMQESETHKTAIVDAALDAIVSMDHRGMVTEWNPAAARMFGYERDQALGRELAELIVPEHLRERHRSSLRRYLETGEEQIIGRVVELAGLRSDGTLFPVELTVRREDSPGPPAFIGFIRDVTGQKAAEAALLEGEVRLRQALEAGRMGTWEWDVASGTVTWSPTTEEIHGLEPGTFGGTFEAYVADIHPEDRPRVTAEVERTIREGGSYGVEYRIVLPNGSQRWLEAMGEVRRNPQGQPVRMIGVCMDVTERREADEVRARLLEGEQAARRQAEESRRRVEFLAEASRVLASSLNHERTLAKVARLVVPWLADWCSVDLVDAGEIRQVAIAHQDEGKVALAKRLREVSPPDIEGSEGIAEVLRTGEPVLYAEVPSEMIRRAARDEEHLRLLESLNIRSAMVVPLMARGKAFGTMSLVASESGRRFDEEDLAFASELADRAAVAIDNARLYEERSHIARSLQRSLLPPGLPEIRGIEVAARYRPAGSGFQVGGDFYDLFERAPGDWVLVIGDVQGKGPDAAAVTGLARHTLRAAAMREYQPSRSLELLNEAMLREATDRFCTVAFARIAPEETGAMLTVACAGHPRPYVFRADGTIEPVGKHGTLLGLFSDVDLHDETIRLTPGDAVFFYTDGVIEDRRAETQDAEVRSVAALLGRCGMEGTIDECLDRIEREVAEMHGDSAQDDVALMLLRVES